MYKKLKKLSIKDRINVELYRISKTDNSEINLYTEGLKYALVLIEDNGWEQLSPKSVREWKHNQKKKN